MYGLGRCDLCHWIFCKTFTEFEIISLTLNKFESNHFFHDIISFQMPTIFQTVNLEQLKISGR